MLAYYTLSIFPTSIVGISNSLQPLIVVFLAFILLKEKLTAYDLFQIVFAMSGAILIVSGDKTDKSIGSAGTWGYIALALNPILLAGG